MRRFLVVLALLLGACTPPSAVTTTGGVTVPPDAETVRPDHVVDGDTFEAGGIRFRLDGINAPDRGECMYEEARDRLEDVLGATVALAATGTDQFGRTLARVHADGLWVNLDMVSAGLALASGGDDVLLRAEDEAFRNRVGLWAVDACGAEGEIPAIAVEPALSVFDPPGPDEDVLGEEQVVLRNEGDHPVVLSGWKLRDESSLHRFTFAPGTTLAPREILVVSSADRGWDPGDNPVWNNGGDLVLVLDDHGRVIARHRY